MGRTKFSSPTLNLRLTEAGRDRAIRSNSGGCLIADAIREQYPEYTKVSVDMATIRITDTRQGRRYVYLTPPAAQHVLLSFDQGWPQPVEELVVKRAVSITPITARNPGKVAKALEDRRARLADLEARLARGETLSKWDKGALTRLRRSVPQPPPVRPTAPGRAEVRDGVVYGGKRPVMGGSHPNLLRGRNRHFGAKLADPGDAFRQAVDHAVNERLHAMDQEGKAS